MDDSGKATGIREIALALGISIGTVDRALHGRSGVSPATKHRVLQMAEQLGYRPNIATRSLKLNRKLRIAAVLPREIACFFSPLAAGIQSAARNSLNMQVSLDMHEYPAINSGEYELLERVGAQEYDGILFTPGRPRDLDPLIRKLVGTGTAMMCVGCDAPDSERTGSVAADAGTSGALAAELFSYKLQKPARIVNITGELANADHAEKLRGFAATLAVLAPHLTLLPVIETHESPQVAYEQALTLFAGHSRPNAIYISMGNSMPVLRALEEQHC